MTRKKTKIIILLCAFLIEGCAAALPIAGAGSAINTQHNIYKLQEQIDRNTKILDYILEKTLPLIEENRPNN